jgi:hypothetical protein
MVKPGAKPNVAAGSDPPAAERFVHHRPDDHETEAVHHDDDIIDHDHDHDRPVNDRDEALRIASASQFRLSAALPAHLLAAGSRTALTVIRSMSPRPVRRRQLGFPGDRQGRTVLDRQGMVRLEDRR